MNRTTWALAALMTAGLAGVSIGDEGPARDSGAREPREARGHGAPETRRDGDRQPEHAGREGGREGGEAHRAEERRHDDHGRPGQIDGFRPRPQPGMPGQNQIEVMRNYLGMVEHYAHMAKDPSSSAIAAVVTAGDLLRPRGADKAIQYFNELLPQVKDRAVERAIRLQLVELHKMSGQHDKALDQLRALITAAPDAPEGAAGHRHGDRPGLGAPPVREPRAEMDRNDAPGRPPGGRPPIDRPTR